MKLEEDESSLFVPSQSRPRQRRDEGSPDVEYVRTVSKRRRRATNFGDDVEIIGSQFLGAGDTEVIELD